MKLSSSKQGWLYAFLFVALLGGEIWLQFEKLRADGTQSWALFIILPVISLAAAVLIHTAIEDLLSWSWRILRAPVSAALAATTLLVVLPTSISSSGSAKDAAVNQAEAANTVVDDAKEEAKRLKKKLIWAEDDKTAKCAKFGQDSRKCLDAKDSVRSFEERRARLLTDVTKTPVKVADSGEKRLVWALALANVSVSEEDIGNGLPMLLSLTLAIVGPFFGAMAMSEFRKVPVVAEPVPTETEETWNDDGGPTFRTRARKPLTEEAISFSREFARRNGHPPTFTQLRGEFPALPKASASRVLRRYA